MNGSSSPVKSTSSEARLRLSNRRTSETPAIPCSATCAASLRSIKPMWIWRWVIRRSFSCSKVRGDQLAVFEDATRVQSSPTSQDMAGEEDGLASRPLRAVTRGSPRGRAVEAEAGSSRTRMPGRGSARGRVEALL